MASEGSGHSAATDQQHRRPARGLVLVGFSTWAAGLGLWETSWVGGLVVSLAGGAALTMGLGSLAGGSLDPSRRVWVPVSISLVLISQGVGSPEFGARVALVGLGTLGVLLVLLHILDERVAVERQLAQSRFADERRRLAGEVHDVVGHTLSASMLHTTAARLSIRSDPDAAIASLERAEQHGRRSMNDIQSVVRLLREDSVASAPTPLAVDLPELVEGFRSAGANISYFGTSGLEDLPAPSALTVYRVVQEGLTNAIRHGSQSAELLVRVDAANTAVEVEISNDIGPRRSGTSGGSGLVGMRERVSAIGGTVEAGPRNDGRWVLSARIPT